MFLSSHTHSRFLPQTSPSSSNLFLSLSLSLSLTNPSISTLLKNSLRKFLLLLIHFPFPPLSPFPFPHAIVNQTFNFICSSQTGIGKTLPYLISLITLSLPYQHYNTFPHNPWSNLRPQKNTLKIKNKVYCQSTIHTTAIHTTAILPHHEGRTRIRLRQCNPFIFLSLDHRRRGTGTNRSFPDTNCNPDPRSILHQKIHRKLYVPDDFPLASPGVPPASKPTNSQPKTGRRLDQSKTNHSRKRQFYGKKIILYFILATAARVPTSTQKSALLDVAYDKRRDCVARPLPYPSYFNISLPPLPPLPRCSIPHELQLSAHPSFVNELSPPVDYIFRLLALVRFVLATQLKTGPQPYHMAYADISNFPQSYRSTTCQIPHRKTILWFK